MSTAPATTKDALLTIKCAAELSHCSEKTFRRQIENGTLSGCVVRIGMRTIRINRAKLLAGELNQEDLEHCEVVSDELDELRAEHERVLASLWWLTSTLSDIPGISTRPDGTPRHMDDYISDENVSWDLC